MARYNVFVSHAWTYSDRYFGVIGLLDTAKTNLSWFDYYNYSVPKHDPIASDDEKVKNAVLRAALKEQIRLSSVIIVPAGMYVYNRYWIQEEINMAKTEFVYPKPLIGIRRRGQERTPADLESQCDEMVNWNSNSLANAIKNQVG